MSCCTGVVPLNRSFGGDCASWLVRPINPRSTATKTAANRTHGTVPSQGRIQTSAAATAVRTTAKSVASRTVPTTKTFAGTPAKTWRSEAGAVAAQMAKAAARRERHEGRDPVPPSHRVLQPLRPRVGAVDPTREQHADGGRHRDHVAALQALMPVERQAVEHVLEWCVGAEGKEEAEDPDRVPREPVTRRQPARPPSVDQCEDRDEGEHTEVQADLGQVVLAEELLFAEAAVTAVEVRDQSEDAERRRETPGGGEHATPPLRVTDRLEARQPLNGGKREGEDMPAAPLESTRRHRSAFTPADITA